MSLASSSSEGLVMWLTLDSEKFEFCDSKTRFYKPNSASQAENAFSRRISKFEIFSETTLLCPNITGKAFRYPWNTPKPIPYHLSTSKTILRNLKFFISKFFFKHFISNFNVILRFCGHGVPKNNFFQTIKTIWKIRPERI